MQCQKCCDSFHTVRIKFENYKKYLSQCTIKTLPEFIFNDIKTNSDRAACNGEIPAKLKYIYFLYQFCVFKDHFY